MKRIERCQAKAESDYSSRQYPGGSCLVDLIRCSLSFTTCEDLLKGLKLVIDRVNDGDTCFKRVVRVKNMFKRNNNDKYSYRDIKLNLLMEYKGRSMICEGIVAFYFHFFFTVLILFFYFLVFSF